MPNYNQSPTTHNTEPSPDSLFQQALVSGEHFAGNILKGNMSLNNDGFDEGTTSLLKKIDEQFGETTKRTTEMYLYSTLLVDLYKSRSTHKRLRNAPITDLNRSIREVIVDADKTSFMAKNLVAYLTHFATNNGLLEKDLAGDYSKEVESVINGMLAEQNAANLLIAAGIPNVDATPQEDAQLKVDLFIHSQDQGSRFGVDVKCGWRSIAECAEDIGESKASIREFSVDGSRQIHPYDERKRATLTEPVVFVVPFKNRYVMYVDYGDNHQPQRLAPKKFSPKDEPYIDTIKQAYAYMDSKHTELSASPYPPVVAPSLRAA